MKTTAQQYHASPSTVCVEGEVARRSRVGGGGQYGVGQGKA